MADQIQVRLPPEPFRYLKGALDNYSRWREILDSALSSSKPKTPSKRIEQHTNRELVANAARARLQFVQQYYPEQYEEHKTGIAKELKELGMELVINTTNVD